MLTAYTSTAIRRAEEKLLAASPPGSLMMTAAGKLAGRVADVARERTGSVYGARIALLVGPGNNGGDALYAGAMLRRRGARIDAIMVADDAHREALAAFTRAGGECVWAVKDAITAASPSARPRRGHVATPRPVARPTRTQSTSTQATPTRAAAADAAPVVAATATTTFGPPLASTGASVAHGASPEASEAMPSASPPDTPCDDPFARADAGPPRGDDEPLSAFAATMALLATDEDEIMPSGLNADGYADELHRTTGTPPTRHPGVHMRTRTATDGRSSEYLSMPGVSAVLDAADIVVDGMFGIGGRAGLHGVAASLAAHVPTDAYVIAVDLPSGLDCDSGPMPRGTVLSADETVTFGARKPCHVLPPARYECGQVRVADIGLELEHDKPAARVITAADVGQLWPVPNRRDHKYSRGVLGIVAGGDAYTGAAVLTVRGALGAGAPMVRYIGSPASSAYVRSSCPEAVMGAGAVQAWTLGPGVDPGDGDQRYAVSTALGGKAPCVVDAGALTVLASLKESRRPTCPLILTPHAGELATLMSTTRDEVDRDPLTWAQRAARTYRATVVLKGATTVIVDADGTCYAQADGPAWLATAGSGDVLAGMIGTVACSGIEPTLAGALAVCVHGLAGQAASGGGPVRAGDLPDAAAMVLAELVGPRVGLT